MNFLAITENLKKIQISHITIGIMFILTALTGLMPQNILSAGIVVCFFILFACDKTYQAYPFVIFYNYSYGHLFGISVTRILSVLILISVVLRMGSAPKIKLKYLLPVAIYSTYLIIVMIPVNVFSTLFIFVDVLCCLVLVSNLSEDRDALKSFFAIYTAVCLLSFMSGMISGNHMEYNQENQEISRFLATFEDPNYMGFFFTLAIFAAVSLKLYNKVIRIAIVVTLYIMILYTLSITAIVLNIIMWVIYLAVTKKIRISSICIIAIVAVLCVSLYNYGLKNPDTEVIGPLSSRISEKLEETSKGNYDDATTNRTALAEQHFKYYLASSPLTKILGGIPVNTRYIHPDLRAGAHNEYIDMLLNIGIVGTVIMLGYFLNNLIKYINEYKKSKEDKYLFLSISKILWLCYAMTLTMFLDFRFMLLFLI